MSFPNGQIPVASLKSIGGGLYLRKDAAEAWLALQRAAVAHYGRQIRVSDAYRKLGSPGDYARGAWSQWAAWERYQHGGNLAARPGTSNHGLGLAVDINTADRYILDALGPKFGWSKAWSDAPSEPWHIKWKEGNYPAVKQESHDPVLKRGGKNPKPAVIRLKKLLKDAGVKKASGKHVFPPLVMNGVMGPSVVTRVKWFQKHKMGDKTPDGIVGPKTWAALEKAAKH